MWRSLTGVEPVPPDRQSGILPLDLLRLPPVDSNHDFRFRAGILPLDEEGISKLSKLAAGERFERPYPDSKSRVLPLDDPASRFQRDCFHAPYTQDRRFIDVVAKSPAIRARTIHQLAVISSAVAVKLRCKLYLKAFEFNHLCTHNLVAARRIELPSQP